MLLCLVWGVTAAVSMDMGPVDESWVVAREHGKGDAARGAQVQRRLLGGSRQPVLIVAPLWAVLATTASVAGRVVWRQGDAQGAYGEVVVGVLWATKREGEGKTHPDLDGEITRNVKPQLSVCIVSLHLVPVLPLQRLPPALPVLRWGPLMTPTHWPLGCPYRRGP